VLLERSILAAGSGGTVPVRTEVALALHSLLLYLHTFYFFFTIIIFVLFLLYSPLFFLKREGEHWEGGAFYYFLIM